MSEHTSNSGNNTFRGLSLIYRHAGVAIFLATVCAPLLTAQFVKPTDEELKMTSMPGYPGTPAVVLFKEEITQDDLHVQKFYDRIKILTEDGKKYANVELPFYTTEGYGDTESNGNAIGDIEGRTIHPDGTIVPFTGKPYLKVVEKEQGFKVQERIFTLPDVTVGSIIEYRYALRYNDHVFEAPDWFIQSELYLKDSHFLWQPTTRELTDPEADAPINAISWFPILPPGVKVEHRELPNRDQLGNTQQVYELRLKDVPPMDTEEYMPPIGSFSYRVYFNFTAYRSNDEYWKSKGKSWSKHADSFIGPNNDLRAATRTVIEGAATDDEKLHKIYAAVMALENTDYSRQHERQEDKAAGMGKVNNTADVFAHKRGNGLELTYLFIGMARAAGMKAYAMRVTARDETLFAAGWLNERQLNSSLAIVNVGGKEVYFDPGSRYTPYGKLIWQDTLASGERQVDGGMAFGATPGIPYSENVTGRAANLKIDDHGALSGILDVSYKGEPALTWRHRALREDEESVKHALQTSMEEMLPKNIEVKVSSIQNLSDYEKPLLVKYTVTGGLGTATGKRLVIPVDLFRSQEKPAFPHEKREQSVYFHYAQQTQDAIRVNFPDTMQIEAAPPSSRAGIKDTSAYVMEVTPAPTSITVRRSYAFNTILVKKEDYPELRSFYSQFESKDQESIVLKQGAPTGN